MRNAQRIHTARSLDSDENRCLNPGEERQSPSVKRERVRDASAGADFQSIIRLCLRTIIFVMCLIDMGNNVSDITDFI